MTEKSWKFDMDNTDIEAMSIYSWKKYVKEKVKITAFRYLIGENSNKEKTNYVLFEKLEMSEYLVRNKRTSLSKIIFSVRSKTLDWLPLN